MAKTSAKNSNLSLELKEIKGNFNKEFEHLKVVFLKQGHSYDVRSSFQSRYIDLIDKTITSVSKLVFRGEEPPAVVAVGGYGRGELAPFSDIDIVFVHDRPFDKDSRKYIEDLTAHLWEMHIRLSASTRTLQECEKAMGEDPLFLTGLLEKRLVWGTKAVYQQLEKTFRHHLDASPEGFFVSTKLDERDARHLKMGDSRYQLEPNVKESKGGLRDIHTLMWIANFVYGAKNAEDLVREKLLTQAEAKTLKQALDFFWTVRCHLHFIAGRSSDRLSFDSQPHVAEAMGYDDAEPNVRAEKFMKDYFLMAREVGHLTRVLCAKMEEDSRSGGATAGSRKLVFDEVVEEFPIRNNRLTVVNKKSFVSVPADIIRIFRVSQKTGIDIHPDALHDIRNVLADVAPLLQENADAAKIFMEILLDPRRTEQTLRRLNEADILAALIHDFGNIVAHMQYDMYHSFTADEHTIRSVGMMHAIENGTPAGATPLATSLFPHVHSRRALYTAMFLHDIAKGTGGDHSGTGANIARALCPRLGLTHEETETVAWLVQEHLAMTMTAFKRDLNDPKTIDDFVATVQSPERLKLLTILTTADIMAVGPERWNNWKAGLLQELYQKTADAMAGAPRSADDAAAYAQRYLKSLGRAEVPAIKITPQPKNDYTEVIIYAKDRKGLFATLSGAMAAAGASIVDARIFTLTEGLALDVFHVQNLKGQVYENANFLTKALKSALDGKGDVTADIDEKQKSASKKDAPFKIPPRVIIDNNASNSNTVIEVNGKDRPGFLHDVTSALSRQGLQISAAKIATFGSRAVDVFYVRDNFGLKVLHPEKLQEIESAIKHAIKETA